MAPKLRKFGALVAAFVKAEAGNADMAEFVTPLGSETRRRLSAIPFTAFRRCWRETRIASAGTPTTACTVLPEPPALSIRWPRSSRTAASAFGEPSLMRPRSSGRWRSSIGRFSSASWPKRTAFFTTLRATMSTGHPT